MRDPRALSPDPAGSGSSSAGRCPICGRGISLARFESGTTIRWCEVGCWSRIDNRDGVLQQETTQELAAPASISIS